MNVDFRLAETSCWSSPGVYCKIKLSVVHTYNEGATRTTAEPNPMQLRHAKRSERDLKPRSTNVIKRQVGCCNRIYLTWANMLA